jgi:hypothetical protein
MAEVRTLKDGTLCKINDDGSIEKIRGKICTNIDCSCVNEFNAKFCSKCGSSFEQTLDNIIISDKSKCRTISCSNIFFDDSSFRTIKNSDINTPEFYLPLFITFIFWVIFVSLVLFVSYLFDWSDIRFDTSMIFSILFWSLFGTIYFMSDSREDIPFLYRKKIKNKIQKIEKESKFDNDRFQIFRIISNNKMGLFKVSRNTSKIIEFTEEYDVVDNICWLNRNNIFFMSNGHSIDLYDVVSGKVCKTHKIFQETKFESNWIIIKNGTYKGILDIDTMDLVLKPERYSLIEESLLGTDLLVLVKDKKIGLFSKTSKKMILPIIYSSIKWESDNILEAQSVTTTDYYDILGNKINT